LRVGLGLPGVFGDDPVEAVTIDLLAFERQTELFADHPGKEAANRMLLPAGCLHDRRDSRAIRTLEQGEDLLLLSPASRFRFNRFLKLILFLSGSVLL